MKSKTSLSVGEVDNSAMWDVGQVLKAHYWARPDFWVGIKKNGEN